MSIITDLYFVHLYNDFSGSPRVLRDAMDSRLNSGGRTFVFTSKHHGFLDGADAERINCFYARSSNRYIQLIYFLLSQLVVFVKLFFYLSRSRLNNRESTVVINTMLPFGAGLASKFMSKNVIYYVHETLITPYLLKKFLRFFIENCASHVIFVSKYLQSVESFSKPVQDVIYNGLRSDFPKAIQIDKQLKFKKRQVLFAGSLKVYKGIQELLQLARCLPDFNFVAALNCELSELNEFKSKNLIPENIILLSRPQKILQLFESSFAVLNLSLEDGWIETFGLSLIEGLTFGSPVVAPMIGGPVEFVTSDNGLLSDSRDTGKIAEFLSYIGSSFDIWESYSNSAIVTAQGFTSDAYKKSLVEYFMSKNLI